MRNIALVPFDVCDVSVTDGLVGGSTQEYSAEASRHGNPSADANPGSSSIDLYLYYGGSSTQPASVDAIADLMGYFSVQ